MNTKIVVCLLMMNTTVSLHAIPDWLQSAGDWINDEIIQPAGDFVVGTVYEDGLKRGWEETSQFFEGVVYEDIIRPAGEGIATGAIEAYKGLEQAGQWVGERFKDTQVTRGPDFAIRLAALESAKAVATATLASVEQTALAPLYLSRETAKGVLRATEEFLDKVAKNLAVGALVAAAESSKGILTGIEKGTVWTLEGEKIWLTKGILDMFDLNRMYYRGSLDELKSGVLGTVNLEFEIFKQPFTPVVSIDPKAGMEQLINNFEPVVISVVDALGNVVLSPIKNALSSIKETIDPVERVMAQEPQKVEIPLELKQQLEALDKTVVQTQQIAPEQTAKAGEQYVKAKAELVVSLKESEQKANQALQDRLQAITEGKTLEPITQEPVVAVTTEPTTPAEPSPAPRAPRKQAQGLRLTNDANAMTTITYLPPAGKGEFSSFAIPPLASMVYTPQEQQLGGDLEAQGSSAGTFELQNTLSGHPVILQAPFEGYQPSAVIKKLNPTYTFVDELGTQSTKSPDAQGNVQIAPTEKIIIKTPAESWKVTFKVGPL